MARHCCLPATNDRRKALSLFFTHPDKYIHWGPFPDAQPVRLRIGGIPAFLSGLKAVFVSDVHLRSSVPDASLHSLMDLIAAQNADLLLLGGDYAESREDCLRFFSALAKLRFPLGGFAVPGNNDRECISMPELKTVMEHAGVTLLLNMETEIALPGGKLKIGGCDEHEYGSPRSDHLFKDASDAWRILLSHYPVWPDCCCDLMLSGHTHAGQFNLLGITPYSIGFEHNYHLLAARGLHRFGDMRLLVGNGIGVSRIPLRIGAEPQIYLLEFSSEDFH